MFHVMLFMYFLIFVFLIIWRILDLTQPISFRFLFLYFFYYFFSFFTFVLSLQESLQKLKLFEYQKVDK